MRRVVAVAVVASLSLFAAATAHAATITFDFTAVRLGASGTGGTLGPLAGSFANISGSFSYDTSEPASSSSAVEATYPTGSLTIDQFSLESGTTYSEPAFTRVEDGSVIGDGLAMIRGRAVGQPDGNYDFWSLRLSDSTGSAFSSTALPTALALGDFDTRTLNFSSYVIAGGVGTGLAGAVFRIESLTRRETSAPVPEPATLVLLGTGLAAVVLRRRFTERT